MVAPPRPLEPSFVGVGVRVPRLLYGTAWKEDETKRLTELALRQGFRGIDTANQRRHYHEAAVGEAITAVVGGGLVTRAEIFLQTKFTFQGGQDHRLPYDPGAAVEVQVEQSFSSSRAHLGTDVIDSYVLHGPTQRTGLGADDWSAWRAMEAICDSGKARMLGISNVTRDQLDALCQSAHILPSFVQNRCYATTGWDRAVRGFCAAHGVTYQAFSLLTANQAALTKPEIERIATRHGRSVSAVAFRFALHVGMLPLTGTRNPAHMRADLEVLDFALEQEEVERIERIAASG